MPDGPVFLYICTWTLTWTCSIDMDMHYGHGNAARPWTHSTALIMQHVSGQWTFMDAGMPIKSSVRHRKFSVSLRRLVGHRHSGIMVSLVPLVTDQSFSAQLCPWQLLVPVYYFLSLLLVTTALTPVRSELRSTSPPCWPATHFQLCGSNAIQIIPLAQTCQGQAPSNVS